MFFAHILRFSDVVIVYCLRSSYATYIQNHTAAGLGANVVNMVGCDFHRGVKEIYGLDKESGQRGLSGLSQPSRMQPVPLF